MGIMKNFRDALTGRWTTPEDAAARPAQTVAETRQKVPGDIPPRDWLTSGTIASVRDLPEDTDPRIRSRRLVPSVPGVYTEDQGSKPMTRFAFKDEDGKDIVIHVTGSRTYADAIQSMLTNHGVEWTLQRLIMMDPREMTDAQVDQHDRDVADRVARDRARGFYE